MLAKKVQSDYPVWLDVKGLLRLCPSREAAVAGILGGLGYTYYEGAYPISIGILVLGYLAYPKAKELFDILWYE